ncbi:hypothetical protein EYF80_030290 [Liparis tanakae]|uniref:Uncharacterized protein n=1 Tax=Liparis tanakae TaxID=230148 RepID=A0A4Z2H2F0_9TELE|nr:hypothetical protein EYF80_030290 [Liparis tanakae]
MELGETVNIVDVASSHQCRSVRVLCVQVRVALEQSPNVAAACSGVHSSLSQAFTQAPASSRHRTISTKSSMQHCDEGEDADVIACSRV